MSDPDFILPCQSWTQPSLAGCASATTWDIYMGASSDWTFNKTETCPSSSEEMCDSWSLQAPGGHLVNASFIGLGGMLKTIGCTYENITSSVYFKQGSNKLVEWQQQYGGCGSVTVKYSKWDTSTPVASSEFDIPASWNCDLPPSTEAALPGLEIQI